MEEEEEEEKSCCSSRSSAVRKDHAKLKVFEVDWLEVYQHCAAFGFLCGNLHASVTVLV